MSFKIVLDPGSFFCKGGFSHEDSPRVVAESYVEEQHRERIAATNTFRLKSTFTRPMEKGIVTDWDRMERLLNKVLYDDLELDGEVQDYPGMIVAENMCNTRRAREKTAELMFDKFGLNSLCMYSAPLLSLLASSSAHKKQMYSGVVVELGLNNSFVVPVDNFTVYPNAWAEIAYGGEHITFHLSELLSERSGYSCDNATAESAKLSYARVRQNFASEPRIHDIQLANGQMLKLERFECTEPLFKENGFGLPQNIMTLTHEAYNISAGKHKDLIKQNKMRKEDILENLCSNIVLSGGSAVIPGLCSRLHKELEQSEFSPFLNLPCPVVEQYGAWKGAALMANMDAFRHLWVSRAQFEEAGMQVLYKKWLPVNTLK